MLRRIGIQRVNEHIGVKNSGINGHRYKCHADGTSHSPRDARPAAPALPGAIRPRLLVRLLAAPAARPRRYPASGLLRSTGLRCCEIVKLIVAAPPLFRVSRRTLALPS